MRARIGTSGFYYPHWRGVFYPRELHRANWLQYYQERFDTLEVNSTFYQLPKPETFLKWKQSVRPGFMFALKASRLITHLKRLKDAEGALALFLDRAEILGDRLGPVLYQLPPSFELDIGRLGAFLALLPECSCHAFEFRHPSWFINDVRSLLIRQGVSFCIADGPDAHQSPQWITSETVYIRFHGPAWQRQAQYPIEYPIEQLAEWAERIDGYLKEGLNVFAFFNNDAHGFALKNAEQLKGLLGVL
ncbi:MAG: DUF72 domain-containing protein [Nitrospirota bacterium]|nr:DUF72 domain-containing protein [Nitrospirota bacterium]